MARKERREFVFSVFPRFYWRGQSGVLPCMTDIDMCIAWDVHAQEQSIVGKVLFASLPYHPLALYLLRPLSTQGRRASFHIRFQICKKFVHEKSGKLDRAIGSRLSRRTFFKWTISRNPISHFSPREIHGSNDMKILKPTPWRDCFLLMEQILDLNSLVI